MTSMKTMLIILQIIITAYEIAADNPAQELWATWARILKEVSHVLLVAYSALNPIAYCGELICHFCYHNILKKCCFKIFPSCSKCCSEPERYSQQSELDMMKSVGITLNGADPILQQLKELDIQSRILSGLPLSPTNSTAISNPLT